MNKKINNNQLRDFGLIIGLFFPLFIGFVIPALSGHSFKLWTIYISIPFLIIGFIRPRILLNPYKAWMFIGEVLGYINSRLILGIIFFTILQPIAFFMRILNKDPLKKIVPNQMTYREIKKVKKIDLKRIF